MDVATDESRKAPAMVQAMTWARSGRAYAKLGERATAKEQLDKAGNLLGGALKGDTPSWAYWVDETRLTAQIGRALFDLEDYKNAEKDLTAAVIARGEKYPRDRATWQGRIAISQLRTGRLEEACATGRKTMDLLPPQVASTPPLELLPTFRRHLPPH